MSDDSHSLSSLLEQALDQAPFGVSIVDTRGRVVRANQRYAELFGRPLEELIGIEAMSLSREKDREWTRRYLTQLINGELTHYVTDKVYELPDGTERRMRVTAWPLRRDGVFEGIVGIHNEASPRAALADGRVRKLIENIDNTISLIDADGRLLETSGRYRPILGYPRDFWETRSIFDMLHPDDAVRVLGLRAKVLAEPGSTVHEEVRIRDVDGAYQPLHVSAINLLDDPDVRGIVITSRNIAVERRLAESLVERTERAETEALLRSRLIATVSHELRNPLHAMNGLSELLAMSDLPSDAAVLADTLHRQVEGLTAVLDDLLESSRIDAAGVELRPSTTALRPLVDDLVALMSAVANSRPLSVRAIIDPAVPATIDIDGARLRQVLSNLMGNAVKFTDEGSVELRLELSAPDRLRCVVADTGRGIDPDEVDAVFQPFVSARTGGNRVGAGLGLTIVRQLVLAMGASISLSSVVGEGSVFTVDVPFATSSPVDEPRTEPVRPSTAGPVLVVEDNTVNQLLARNQLKRLGIDCVIVGSGEDALTAMAGPDAPRIVLMDFQLPGIDGLETTRRLRAAETFGRRAVIIGVTASAMAADRAECIAAGMDDFLPKPVSLGALGSMLATWSTRSTGDDDHRDLDSANDELEVLVAELGDVTIVHQLIDTYLSEVGQRCDDITAAGARADNESVRKGAHALRSSSYLLGLTQLGDLCRVLEASAATRVQFASADELRQRVDAATEHLGRWKQLHPEAQR
jgi:PAS domain S-box-containing protein